MFLRKQAAAGISISSQHNRQRRSTTIYNYKTQGIVSASQQTDRGSLQFNGSILCNRRRSFEDCPKGGGRISMV